MFRLSCCKPSLMSAGWALGCSLATVTVALGLRWLGAADLYSQALIFAAFPMSMLIGDNRLRRQPVRLLPSLALCYGGMLAIARLAEAI